MRASFLHKLGNAEEPEQAEINGRRSEAGEYSCPYAAPCQGGEDANLGKQKRPNDKDDKHSYNERDPQ